jgi:hypothetical protein
MWLDRFLYIIKGKTHRIMKFKIKLTSISDCFKDIMCFLCNKRGYSKVACGVYPLQLEREGGVIVGHLAKVTKVTETKETSGNHPLETTRSATPKQTKVR